MAKGHRSQIKRARNESNRETRPACLSIILISGSLNLASMSFCHFKVPPFVIFNIQGNTAHARTAPCGSGSLVKNSN